MSALVGTTNYSSGLTPIATTLLRTLHGILPTSTLQRLYSSASLAGIADISHDATKLWTRLPRLVPLQLLYPDDYHSSEELEVFTQSLLQDAGRIRIYIGRHPQTDMSKVEKKRLLSKLMFHKDDNDDLMPKATAMVELSDYDALVAPVSITDCNPEVIWARHKSFTDLHIDHGDEVLSLPIGLTQKVCFLYPPTVHNLTLLDDYAGSNELLDLSANLEGGMMVTLDSSAAIEMPSGCIHAFVTTATPGILISKSFLRNDSLIPLSTFLSNSPNYIHGLSDDLRQIAVVKWLEAARAASLEETLKAWKVARDVLHDLISQQHRAVKNKVSSMWSSKFAIGTIHTLDRDQWWEEINQDMQALECSELRKP